MKNSTPAIKIHPDDNVVVAVDDISAGEKIFGVTASQPVKMGHKMAIAPIECGGNIIKYGYPIGHAAKSIAPGEHVHTHNIRTNLKGTLEYEYLPKLTEIIPVKDTFMGYLRKDGKVGIRNEIWIVNTVGCVNFPAQKIAQIAQERYANRNIDGIFTFAHPYGCSQLGDDHLNTQRILANMVKHPNAGGVLVFGLGCENNTIESFKETLGTTDSDRVKFLVAQDYEDEIEKALELIDELVNYAEKYTRSEVDISNLVIGLKCGGSDGFSGITANALVGVASDTLISHGGTAILTEVPEMFGAETIFMSRCESKEIFNATVEMINNFKEYFIRHNQEVYENPSPGNKDGGISTLEDKSMGCTQKGGIGNVTDVLDYGQMTTKPGLNLLNGPGNDIVAITNLMAAGAHMVLFTTGRGTPVGAPIPTIKISSNSNLAKRKSNWIDYNAGQLLEGKNMDEIGKDFWKTIINIAEGKHARNEENGYREIAIFKDGVTL
ncbi:MAG: altronate dehydratase family protein [Defluviitaleaceae bacterium]|nr:altronate dehydratase family protein [Defluviitaleaceae bacterium]